MGISEFLSFFRTANKKKTAQAKKKGQEFGEDETLYGKGLVELQQISDTDYSKEIDTGSYTAEAAVHENFVRDFEGILGLSGKESNGGKIMQVLDPLRRYNSAIQPFDKYNGGTVLSGIRDTIDEIQAGCDSYITQVKNPWTKSGKRRLALVQALKATLTADNGVILRAIKEEARYMGTTYDLFEEKSSMEGPITKVKLISLLKQRMVEETLQREQDELNAEINGEEA